MKHRTQTAGILGGLLLLTAVGARAADTWSASLSASVDWSAAAWSKNGSPVTDGSFPGATDDILTLTHSGTSVLYLEGDRTIGTLNAAGGSVRIRSGKNGGNAHSAFGLQTINVNAGTLVFMNRNANSLLSVTTNQLNVTGGNLSLGEYNSTSSGVVHSFIVNTSTSIDKGRILGVTNPGFTTIHLGAVSNAGTLDLAWKGASSGTTAFDADTPYAISIDSLTGEGTVTTSVAATGVAPRPTLEIKGVANASFAGLIEDGVATARLSLRKTGAGTQYLRRAAGHTYSGGTVIDGGILAIENTSGSGLGRGAVTVKNGGTLAARYRTRIELGAGNSIRVEAGGKINAGIDGTHGIAVLTLSGASNDGAPILIMDEESALEFRLDFGRGDRIDFVNYETGGLVLNGNTVYFNATTEALGPGSWELFRFDADVSAEAWWNNGGLTLGGGLGVWEDQASFIYTQNGIYLQIIPEPQSIILCLTALGGILILRKKARHTPDHS